MQPERRQHARYPAWLPGTILAAGDEQPKTARIVNLSRVGAAVESATAYVAGTRVELGIAWTGLVLAIGAQSVAGANDEGFPITHLRFDGPTGEQAVTIAALVGALKALYEEEAERSRRPTPLRVVPGSGPDLHAEA